MDLYEDGRGVENSKRTKSDKEKKVQWNTDWNMAFYETNECLEEKFFVELNCKDLNA